MRAGKCPTLRVGKCPTLIVGKCPTLWVDKCPTLRVGKCLTLREGWKESDIFFFGVGKCPTHFSRGMGSEKFEILKLCQNQKIISSLGESLCLKIISRLELCLSLKLISCLDRRT